MQTDEGVGKPLELVIGILSACDNIERRQTIRKTWGQGVGSTYLIKEYNFKAIFLLGTECAEHVKV